MDDIRLLLLDILWNQEWMMSLLANAVGATNRKEIYEQTRKIQKEIVEAKQKILE